MSITAASSSVGISAGCSTTISDGAGPDGGSSEPRGRSELDSVCVVVRGGMGSCSVMRLLQLAGHPSLPQTQKGPNQLAQHSSARANNAHHNAVEWMRRAGSDLRSSQSILKDSGNGELDAP